MTISLFAEKKKERSYEQSQIYMATTCGANSAEPVLGAHAEHNGILSSDLTMGQYAGTGSKTRRDRFIGYGCSCMRTAW